MMVEALTFAWFVMFGVTTVYEWAMCAFAFLPGSTGHRMHEVAYELRPFVLWFFPINAFLLPILAPHFTVGNTIYMVGNLFWWYVAWRDKDDRWKKRKAKVLARIREVAGRLVVVPLPQGN